MRARLLAASASVHVAALAAFMLLHWDARPTAGALTVEMMFAAPDPVPPEPAPAATPVAEGVDMPPATEPQPAEPAAAEVAPSQQADPVIKAVQPPSVQRTAPARPRPAPAKPRPATTAAASAPARTASVQATPAAPAPSPPVAESGPVLIATPRFRAPPAPPPYPPLAREQGQEGEAVIRARLDREGNPEEVLLANSSGYPMLDRAALAAVRRWAFEPGRRGNEPVVAWVQIPVRFALR